MKNVVLALLGISVSFCYAGDKYKLGKVTPEELKIETCPIDPEADAYVMFDLGSVNFDYNVGSEDFEYYFNRKLKIKVLNQNGADEGDFVINLHRQNHKEERITRLKVYSYNLQDGKVEDTKIDKDNIQQEELSTYTIAHKIAVPKVKAGTIIEIEYQVASPFIYNIKTWYFQRDIPVEYSRFTTDFPEFYRYSQNMRGYIPVNSALPESKSHNFSIRYREQANPGTGGGSKMVSFDYNSINDVRTYVAENVPAFKDEPYLSSRQNFISALDHELMQVAFKGNIGKSYSSTWDDVDKLLIGDDMAGGFVFDGSRQARDILSVILSEGETEEEKLQKIYYALRNKVNWNEYLTYYTKSSPSKIWESGKGSSGDMNLLLGLLLNQAGFEAYPVFVSTRNNGYIYTGRPALDQFNHVIILVKQGEDYIKMDLTGGTNPPGLLPTHSINGSARLVTREHGTWVTLKADKKKSDQYIYQVSLDDEESLTCKSIWRLNQHSALYFNNNLFKANDIEERLSWFAEEYPTLTFDSLSFTEELFTGNLEFGLDFKLNAQVDRLGDKLMIQPYVLNDYKNPFVKESRIYPVDYASPVDKSFMITLETPAGYEISTVPEAAKVMLPNGEGMFIYQATNLGSSVQINCKFQLKKDLFTSESYPYLKQFYEMAESKVMESVVFVKKS